MPMSRSTLIMAAIGILVLAAGIYLLFFRSEGETVVSEQIPGAATEAETTFINLVAEIDPISFDTSVLSDPRYRALEDIGTTILPEATGRTDPFAPVPGVSTP